LALKAVVRLIDEDAFSLLNKTENYIAFASTGNNYLDYSLTMRKTINLELFYEIFPDIREKDLQFNVEMDKNRHLSVSEYLDYWTAAVHDGYSLESPYKYVKSELDIFKQLERFGNNLANECLERLKRFTYDEGLERKDYEKIYYYVEALHFSGHLTEMQRIECSLIADQMTKSKNDLTEATKFLTLIS
jgi:hypothetical protein